MLPSPGAGISLEVTGSIRSAVCQPDIKGHALSAALGNDKCLKQRVDEAVATQGSSMNGHFGVRVAFWPASMIYVFVFVFVFLTMLIENL